MQIAKCGLSHSAPNPSVGCVIVYNNIIIGEGFTSAYGSHHAEVNAINSVKNKALLTKSTLYVTLEPCSHHGKTPPCANLIIKHNIPNIVIGTTDIHKKVAGKGIKQLKAHGCQVTVAVLEQDCKAHHKRFFTFQNKQRPFVILKWAETSNGFIAPKSKNKNRPVWISNSYSKQLVHKWRAEEQAILIGTNTAIADNPLLTCRLYKGNHPIRYVVNNGNTLSNSLNVFNDEAKTYIISNQDVNFKSLNIAKQICDYLYKQNITSIIIEGGQKTLQAFINENLWDEARVFISKTTFKDGIKSPKLNLSCVQNKTTSQIDNNILNIYTNQE